MAAPKKAVARKAPAKKVPARKSPAASKAAAKPKVAQKGPVRKDVERTARDVERTVKDVQLTVKDRAEKALNVYMGLLGVGYDLVQENLEYARKDNKLRMKQLEKRGAKLRQELRKNMSKFEAREFDQMFESVQEQFDKLQKKMDEFAKDIKARRKPAAKAKAA